jgi:hypothetical protein
VCSSMRGIVFMAVPCEENGRKQGGAGETGTE